MYKHQKSYLEELLKWGDDILIILNNSEGENIEQNKEIVHWQEEIRNHLKSEEIQGNDLEYYQREGERIFANIRSSIGKKVNSKSVPYGKHKLPPLPYKYNALEPYISEKIMRLHHDVHHRSYVEGLNEAENHLYINKQDKKIIKHWLREQAYHGSGHYLHTIFWFNMTPNSGKEPKNEIRQRIEKDFGTWAKFKELFSDVANSVEGVGWAVLLWAPRSGRLAVQSFEKHQLFQIADTIPLLVLDMWEHAYYLQYETDKKDYIKNWWNVVNWDNVNMRYKEASKVMWSLY